MTPTATAEMPATGRRRRTRRHSTAPPAAGSPRATTVIFETSTGWLITHRGRSLPGFGQVGHDGPRLLEALTRISREITAIEMRVSDARAHALAARRPLADTEAQRERISKLTEQLRRVNTGVLLRRAVRVLGPTTSRTLAQDLGDDDLLAVLREQTALAVHARDLQRAIAARTLELAGVGATRAATRGRSS